MSNVLSPRPDDRPPQREDWRTGVTISVVAHASLVAALVWGLHWRSSTQESSASAELWAAVPEAAAPPPVEEPPPPPPPPAPKPVVETPPPPPVETPKPPDIVTEQVPQRKPPKPKPPPPPPPPPPAPAPKPAPAPPPPPSKDKLDAKALQKLHDDNLKRMLGQMDAPATNVGRAARSSGPSAGWAGRVAALINSHLVYGGSMDGLHPPDVQITLMSDGSIVRPRIVVSSGNAAYDDAVLRAVLATNTLPRDTDGTLPPSVVLNFKP